MSRILAILAIIVVVFGVSYNEASAQAVDADWCYLFLSGDGISPLFNFDYADNFNDSAILGIDPSTYNVLLDRIDGDFGTNSGAGHSVASTYITLPFGSEFVSVGFTYTKTRTTSSSVNRPQRIVDHSYPAPGSEIYYSSSSNAIGTATREAETPGATSLRFSVMGFQTSSPAPGVFISKIRLNGIGPDPFASEGRENLCGDALVRPYILDDEDEWSLYENAETSAVVSVGKAPGVPVHAAAAGTVLSVKPLTLDRCNDYLWDFNEALILATGVGAPGFLPIYAVNCAVWRDNGGSDFIFNPGTSFAYNPGLESAVTIPGYFSVEILMDAGDVLEYFVADADKYVFQGLRISAGCVLGVAGEMKDLDLTELLSIPPQITLGFRGTAEQGLAVVVRKEIIAYVGSEPQYDTVELLDDLIVYPTTSTPCDNPYTQCIGETTFSNPDGWFYEGNVEFRDGYVSLIFTDIDFANYATQPRVWTEMNLDPTRYITVSVIARGSSVIDAMIVQVGVLEEDFALTPNFEEYVFEAGLGVGADLGEFYTIGVQNSLSPLVDVMAICVSQHDDEEPPEGPAPPPPLAPNCSAIEQPATETLVAQIGWLWASLDDFFQCDLMRLLQKMYLAMLDMYRFAGWSMKWHMLQTQNGIDWLTYDGIYWMNGHLSNIAVGRQTFIQTQTGQQCDNLFCFVESIFNGSIDFLSPLRDIIVDAIGQAFGRIIELFDFFVDLLQFLVLETAEFILIILLQLIRFGLRIISIVFGLFDQARALLGILVTAWNNTEAIPITGLPTCQVDPESNGFCMLMWLLENTVFSGTLGLIIPIIISWASIMMIIWLIREFKAILMEVRGV